MFISQASILAGGRGVDFNKKFRESKKFSVKIIKYNQIEAKKSTKFSFQKKTSLKKINQYQFRRDLNKENIPIEVIEVVKKSN